MRSVLVFFALVLCLRAADPVYLTLLGGSGELVYLSPAGKVLSSVPVGPRPREMAHSPDKRYLYVSAGGNTISIVDVWARRRIRDIPLEDYRRPHGVAVHPKTGAIAVVTEAPAQLLLIDAARRTVVKRFNTKGEAPTMVTFGPDGTWAYVSNSGSGNVAAIHIESGETKLVATGDHPASAVLSVDGRELYVLNRDSNNIAILDTARNQVIANIAVGKAPVRAAMSADGKLVYALRDERRIAIADPRQRRQIDYILVPGEPASCSMSNDGQSALVSVASSGTIYILSLTTKKITGEIKTLEGSGPSSVQQLADRLR